MPKVIIHPSSYETVYEAIERIFEVFPLDLRGKKVLIKPNVLRASDPREGIVTNPSVVSAVVEKVESLSPSSIIVGDNPGLFSYGANEESFKKTKLMDASKGYYKNIGTQLKQIDFNPLFLPKLSLSRYVLEADIIISLPKFKTHGLTVITGAIKNSYGLLPGAQKALLHKIAGTPERFHEILVEVFKIRIPDLFIMDAIIGMEGNGPASSDLRNIGLIIASDNGVSMDVVMAKMVGLNPEELRFLKRAQELGLGGLDINDIEIIGELKEIEDFKLPPFSIKADATNEETRKVLLSRISAIPRANPERCTGCATCIEHCPSSALYMNEGIPQVDDRSCIRCFCCQEICPEKAIVLI